MSASDNQVKAPQQYNIIKGKIAVSIADFEMFNGIYRIINSYEFSRNPNNINDDNKNAHNKDEIEKNVTIKINGKDIGFSYAYQFIQEGFFMILNIQLEKI